MKKLTRRKFLGGTAAMLGSIFVILRSPDSEVQFIKLYCKSGYRTFPRINVSSPKPDPKVIWAELRKCAPWQMMLSNLAYQSGFKAASFWLFSKAVKKARRIHIETGQVDKVDGWYFSKIVVSLARLENNLS